MKSYTRAVMTMISDLQKHPGYWYSVVSLVPGVIHGCSLAKLLDIPNDIMVEVLIKFDLVGHFRKKALHILLK